MLRRVHSVVRLCVLIGCTLISPALSSAPADPNETAAQLRSTVERLNALDKWFSETEKQRAIWLVELQRQDRDISQLNQQVANIRDKVQRTDAELAELNEQQQRLDKERHAQAKMIAEHLGAAYRLSGQDFLKQLLNQQSPDTFERMIRYHRYFSESRLEVLGEYQQTLTELEATSEQLTEQQTRQSLQQQQLVAEQQELSGERNSRAKVIDQLDTETESKTAEQERLEKDRLRLAELLVELRRRATELDGAAFVAAKGSLPLPAQGKIRHAFGSRRASGRLRWHGIDIAAAQGSPVTAVYRGRVVFADWLRGFGLLTILDHGSDYMTLYGHADALYKKVGDEVESGEVIAGAGNSGGTAEAGIYFEVRHKGQPKDPITWVAR